MKAILVALLLVGVVLGCKKEENKVVPPGTTQSATASGESIPAPPDVQAPPADAQKLPTGVAYKVLQAGTGTVNPVPEDNVKMNFSMWTTDGKLLESSFKRGRPGIIGLNRLIPGWRDSVLPMVAGEKRRVWIPEDQAYKGAMGAPKGVLVMEIELLEIIPAPKPIAAPSDVAQPPADAQKTASGLASKILKPGKGTRKPKATDEVEVHYSGWTTDGKMFDSSVTRGSPASFPLNGVIKGWTEGLQLMVEGESRRFWIPEELAYKGSPGRPQGMLVFDVELLSIKTKP